MSPTAGVKEIGYEAIWVILNFFFSLWIGIALLVTKCASVACRVLLYVMAGALVLMDILPLAETVVSVISKQQARSPWTLVVFAIHSYLFYKMVTNRSG